MSLRQRNKVNVSYSMASMTDIVFLLLLFFMITSTLITPSNALRLLLPQSNSKTAAKPVTTISITSDLKYYMDVGGQSRRVAFPEIETLLRQNIGDNPDAFISLHADKSVPVEQIVRIMNIARNNQYKMILATSPEK